jgi:hypothetical protein
MNIYLFTYLFIQVLNSPTAMAPGTMTKSKQVSFADAVEANRAFSPAVKEHLRSTYAHFAGGLAMTGTFAYIFHRTGWSARIMMSEYCYFENIKKQSCIFFSFS